MLDSSELTGLMSKIQIRVLEANRRGSLDELLSMMNMAELSCGIDAAGKPKLGKIAIIGASEVKDSHLKKTAESVGISRERLELFTEYDRIKNYNFKALQHNSKYSAVLLGPMPHSTSGTGAYSSAIAALESENGYPYVSRLMKDGQLKITKTVVRQTLQDLIAQGYIAV